MYKNSLRHLAHCIKRIRIINNIEGSEILDEYLAKRFISKKYKDFDSYIKENLNIKQDRVDDGSDN